MPLRREGKDMDFRQKREKSNQIRPSNNKIVSKQFSSNLKN